MQKVLSSDLAANLPEKLLLSWYTFTVFYRFFIKLLFSHTAVVYTAVVFQIIKFPGFWVLGVNSYVKSKLKTEGEERVTG